MTQSSLVKTLLALPLAAALFSPSIVAQDPTVAHVGHSKVSTVLGKAVRNKEKESLGEIRDLVFNKDGKISYAVMTFGGFLGMGEKFFALPWESLTAGPESTFVLDVEKSRLKNAPGFDEKSWPNIADAEWSKAVDSWYYEPKSIPDRSWGGKAASLNSANVRNTGGVEIGKVEEIILDLESGRATMVVIHTDRNVEPKDSWVAIPWNSMTPTTKENYFTLNTTDTILAQSTHFGKDKWPNMDRTFTKGVYRHFGRDLDVENPVGNVQRPVDAQAEPASCCRTTQLVGRSCRMSSSSDKVAVVKDLIVSANTGRVMFVIVDTSVNDGKYRSIPFSICKFTQAGDCILSCDAAGLDGAPSFPEAQWPDFSEAKCQSGIYSHFGVKPDQSAAEGK